jgi:hypothetical protein
MKLNYIMISKKQRAANAEYVARWYAAKDAQCKELLGPSYHYDITVNDCVHD